MADSTSRRLDAAVELWTVPAAELLAAGDVGLIPWVPLAASTHPPDVVLRRCRDAIDERASAAEKPNLLVVTQILTSLRYNDLQLLSILGGRETMIKFPVIQEFVAERARRDLLTVLETRFGRVPQDLDEAIEAIEDDDELAALLRKAVSCADVDAFRVEIER